MGKTFEEMHPDSGVGKPVGSQAPGPIYGPGIPTSKPVKQAVARKPNERPSNQPSDFERGVLQAATFLRTKGPIGNALARELLETTPKDVEGTEARVSGRIADWLLDNGVPLTTGLAVDLSSLAKDVRSGAWKLP